MYDYKLRISKQTKSYPNFRLPFDFYEYFLALKIPPQIHQSILRYFFLIVFKIGLILLCKVYINQKSQEHNPKE